VSVAAALLWSKNPTLDWRRIKALILNGAEDGRASAFGRLCHTEGRLNLKNSLNPAILGDPAIFSITPSMAYNAGEIITIMGVGFGATQGTSSLKFQDSSLTVMSWSDEKIVVKLPSTLSNGYGRVTVSTAKGVSRGGVPSRELSVKGRLDSLLCRGAGPQAPRWAARS